MKYKALLSDVDGTLIPYKLGALPSEKVINAIKKAGQSIHIGVATARPLSAMHEIFDSLAVSGPSVITGGAQVLELPSKEILWERLIVPEDVIKACDVLKKYTNNILVFDHDRDYDYSDAYVPHRPYQIYAQSLEPEIVAQILDEVSSISGIAAHGVKSWAKDMQDVVINHAEATKQHGVFEVAKLLNISTSEIIGVGDGYNDFPLLMACGLKVAMGNAPDSLKAIADYVAPTVEDDGVADLIEKFIL